MARKHRVVVQKAPPVVQESTLGTSKWLGQALRPIADEDLPRAPLAITGLSSQRTDAWINLNTGAGTNRDKARGATFVAAWILGDPEITALYNEDDVAATIVDLPVDEMFRRGYHVRIKPSPAAKAKAGAKGKKPKPGATPEDDREDKGDFPPAKPKPGDKPGAPAKDASKDEGDPEAEAALTDSTPIVKAAAKVCLTETLIKAAKWGRAYGGGLCFIAWNDGQNPALPLNPERINKEQPILYTKAFDRRYAIVQDRDNDPLSPTFGEALTFSVGVYAKVTVHASRCIRFEGTEVDEYTRYSLLGWTPSVLQRPYVALQQFSQAYLSIGNLITDASQGIFKLRNLISLMSTKNGTDTVIQRMQTIDMCRSSMRAAVLDADGEDFERVQTPFQGIPELLEAFERRLSAACRIPVTLLMGEPPAGMQATGDSDIRFFYDSVARQQPAMSRKMMQAFGPLAQALGFDPEEVSIEWPPLWEMTDKERADTDLVNAQRDVALVNAKIWPAEWVALSRAKGISTTADTEVDEVFLQKMKAQFQDFNEQNGPAERAALLAPKPAPGAKGLVGEEEPGKKPDPSENMGQKPGVKERKS